MKTFITTDTHFNHKKLIDWGRPWDFENILLRNLKLVSGVETMLIHLGDVCLGHDEQAMSNLVLNTPLMIRVLVKGNHDHKRNNWYLQRGFHFVCDEFSDIYRGKKILFSHVPQPKRPGYDYNFHGHCHGSAHRDMDKPADYDPTYHIDFAPELTDYKPVQIETYLQ